MITHPEDFIQASLDDMRGFAEMGAFIEHSLCMFVEGSRFQRFSGEQMGEYIRAAGVDLTVMASDLGQKGEMSQIDGFHRGIEMCLRLGTVEVGYNVFSLTAGSFLGFLSAAYLCDAIGRRRNFVLSTLLNWLATPAFLYLPTGQAGLSALFGLGRRCLKVSFGSTLRSASADVVLCRLVTAHAGNDHPVERGMQPSQGSSVPCCCSTMSGLSSAATWAWRRSRR